MVHPINLLININVDPFPLCSKFGINLLLDVDPMDVKRVFFEKLVRGGLIDYSISSESSLISRSFIVK